MTDRKTLEAALVTLEAQRDILGDAVVDTSIAAIQTKLATMTAVALPTDKMVSVLLVVSLPPDMAEPNLLTGHIQRCIERQHGQHLLVDEKEQIAVFQVRNDDDNVVDNAIRAAQAILVAPQAHRATYSLIPPMQIAIQSVIVREGIVEPHDFLAHLQTPLLAVRAVLQQAKTTFAKKDRTTILVSEAAFSFVQDNLIIGEKLRVETQDWFVVEDFNDYSTLLYPHNIVPRLIERKSELELLQTRYRQTLTERRCHLMSIVGVLGVGKTRLLTEYELWLDLLIERLWFFKGQASSHISPTPFSLFRNVFQHRFRISDHDSPDDIRHKLVTGVKGLVADFPEDDALIMGHLLGFDIGAVPLPARIHVDDAIQREIMYPIVGQLFRRITQVKNNVLSLILEDLQWADSESLGLLVYLMETCQDVPLICVCTMRPTMFEHVSDWTTRIENTQVSHDLIELRSMSESAIGQVFSSLLHGRADIPEASTQTIIRRAGGNPFQLEELIHLLIEEDIINTATIPWRFDEQQFAAIEMPTSLMGLIQARLFSLPPEERLTLQRAATIGDQFWETAVEYLNKSMTTPTIRNTATVLTMLDKKRLITTIGTANPEFGNEYRFVHRVWQTVAYDSLPQQSLQLLHSALSQWYIGQGLDSSGNNAKLVAHHFELAGDQQRAVKWYGMAAKKAQDNHQPPIAMQYYQHALNLLQNDVDDMPTVLTIYEGLGETLTLLARYDHASSLYTGMCMIAESTGDLAAQSKAWNRLVEIEINRSDTESGMNCAIRAMETAELAGDSGRLELATAWYNVGFVYLSRHQAHEAEEWLRKALALSETLKADGLTARIEKSYGHFYVLNNDYAEAISHLTHSLDRFRVLDDVAGMCNLLSNLAEVFRRQGNYDQARDLLHEALRAAEETRSRREIVFCLSDLAGISTLQGQHQIAKTQLQHVLAMTLPMGWWGIVGTYRYLTQANLGLGNLKAAHQSAQLTFEWATKRQLITDLGIAWRILGITAAAQDGSIMVEEHVYSPAECFENSCDNLEKHDMGELAESYRVWADYEFAQGNDFKGDELWQMAGQCFAEIGATSILAEMNARRNFT